MIRPQALLRRWRRNDSAPPIDVERLSPLGSDHLTLTGRYRVALADALRDRSAYRELNAGPAVAA